MRLFVLVAVIYLSALLFGSTAFAAPAERDFPEWIKVLEPHLRAVWSDGGVSKGEQPVFDWRRRSQFVIELDKTGPPANAYYIPGGVALLHAAEMYALHSGDFSVSLGDLEQSGWWPYATIPAEMDRSLTVFGQGGSRVYTKNETLKHIGSPNWVSRAKQDVLFEFYRDFFFRLPAKENEQRFVMPTYSSKPGPIERPKWTEDYGARMDKTPADLPARHEHFWINPYTNIPMRVSEEAGDLNVDDMGFLRDQATFVDPEGKVNTGHIRHSSRREKPPKLELVRINWKQEPPLPWDKRTGQTPAPLPSWLAQGADSPSLQAHQALLLTRFKPLDEYGRTNEMPLDTSGERAPLATLACPVGLSLAASYYAITTGDVQVSLRDIIEGGFWPYNTFPDNLDLSETLYDFPQYEQPNLGYSLGGYTNGEKDPPSWGGELATDMGTPQWLLWRKAEILNQVHSELFFHPQPGFAPAQGIDPRAADVLPRFAAFWVNPVASAAAGQPIPLDYGPIQGQLSTVDVNLLRPMYGGALIRYEQEVPLINLADKTLFAAGAEPNYIYREHDVQGITQQSCAWPLADAAGGGYAEMRWTYSDPVGFTSELLLDVGWDPLPPAQAQYPARDYRRHYRRTRTYKRGEQLEWTHVGGWPLKENTAQISYDSLAIARQRYGNGVIARIWDYNNMVNALRMNGGWPQFFGGQAGIDPLAPPEQVELAAR